MYNENQIVIESSTPSTVKLFVEFSDLNQIENRPITRFILAEDYPEYQSYTNKDGMAPKRGTSYFTGLAMPGTNLNKYCDDCDNSEGSINIPLY